MIRRCFGEVAGFTLLLLLLLLLLLSSSLLLLLLLSKTSGEMRHYFRFPTKNDFLCLCFYRFGLKLIFRWKGRLFILTKLLFSSRAEILLAWIRENNDVWSANISAFVDYPYDKALIFIKNNNGINIDPWETTALTSDQSEICPFNKNLCFLYLRKSIKDLVS